MTGEVWRREDVASPCVKVCVVHPEARLCVGCLRNLDEIAGWSRMSAEARAAVIADLPSRAALLKQRRGGRGGRAGRLERGG